MIAQSNQVQMPYTDLFRANQRIADQALEIEQLTIARNAQARRADRAEQLYYQLESQLTNPAREAKSIYTKVKMEADRDRHDAEIAKLESDGWEFRCDNVFIDAGIVERYTTFSRIARPQLVPDQPQRDAVEPTVELVAAAEPAPPIYPVDPVKFPPAQPSISNLWAALYDMDRFAELVQHWPDLPEYAPRIHDIFLKAGCDMTNAIIVKSYRPGRRDDVLTVKVSFPSSQQVPGNLRQGITGNGLDRLIEREGREFIFDLPKGWLAVTSRKTITASSMTIMDGDAPAPAADLVANDRANLNAMVTDLEITHEAFHRALINSRLPHAEQDDLLIQSRQVRVGQRIAAQVSRIPSYQPHPINSFLTGGK